MPFQKGNQLYKLRQLDGDKIRESQKPWRYEGKVIKSFCIKCEVKITRKAKYCTSCWGKKMAESCIGKKSSEETIKKLSEAHIGQVAWNKGKGNGRKYIYYPNKFRNRWFRKEIKERDGYKCQGCGINEQEHIEVFGKTLDIHHIDHVGSNLLLDNLITVCKACNARANHNIDYWIEFYRNKLRPRAMGVL